MSYDFTFLCLSPYPEEFPFTPSKEFNGKKLPFNNEEKIISNLITNGFSQIKSSSDIKDRFRWNTPDGGQLEVTVTNEFIQIKVHAHWKHVLELYQHLMHVEPELLVLDDQKITFFNEASYIKYICNSYAKKT